MTKEQAEDSQEADAKPDGFTKAGSVRGELHGTNIIVKKGKAEILSISKADADAVAKVLLTLSR